VAVPLPPTHTPHTHTHSHTHTDTPIGCRLSSGVVVVCTKSKPTKQKAITHQARDLFTILNYLSLRFKCPHCTNKRAQKRLPIFVLTTYSTIYRLQCEQLSVLEAKIEIITEILFDILIVVSCFCYVRGRGSCLIMLQNSISCKKMLMSIRV